MKAISLWGTVKNNLKVRHLVIDCVVFFSEFCISFDNLLKSCNVEKYFKIWLQLSNPDDSLVCIYTFLFFHLDQSFSTTVLNRKFGIRQEKRWKYNHTAVFFVIVKKCDRKKKHKPLYCNLFVLLNFQVVSIRTLETYLSRSLLII